MICKIMTKTAGNYYTKGDLNAVLNSIKAEIPLTCFWYADYGRRFEEDIIFPDEDEIRIVCTETDSGILEDM